MTTKKFTLPYVVALLAISSYTIAQPGGNGYSYTLAGGIANEHGIINPTSATMLIGGAEAGASAEIAATTWFLNHANGGDYLVVRTGGTGGQAAWIWDNFNSMISSAAEISIDSRNVANNATVAQYIYDAEAIFIAGGDQTSYMENWKDTEVETALNFVINTKGVPVSGTSAGMAILGGAYYAPASNGVLSSEILNDPYHSNMTNSLFFDDFLQVPYLSNVVTDTHLDRVHGSGNENRYGRMFGFLARTVTDKNTTDRYAIGCEEGTFVCITSNGVAKVYGNGMNNQTRAYFLQVSCQAPETINTGSPLLWDNGNAAVKVYQIPGTPSGNGNSFDLNDWSTAAGGGWMDWYTSGGYSGFNFVNGSGASTSANPPTNCSHLEECNVPDALNSGNITSSSATLSWSNTGADSYTVQYRVAGTTTRLNTTVSSISTTISPLSANAIYGYRVKGVCSYTSSDYSSVSQFTTLDGTGMPMYCASSGNSTQYEYIDEVSIDNTSNLNGDNGGYGDFTNFTFNLGAGDTHTMYIYPETRDQEIFVVWIDFNQDGDFNDAEEEVLFARSRRRVRQTINIPSSALGGITRMRVSMKYANDGEPTPCEDFEFGEVEDYTVNINHGAPAARLAYESSAEIKNDGISIFPNPSSGTFKINLSQEREFLIEVFDLLGNRLLVQRENTVNLSHMKSGIYVMKITVDGEYRMIRMTKE